MQMTEKLIRMQLRVNATNMITDLKDLIRMLNDSDYDLVDIDIKIDRINRENQLQDILESCDEY